MVKSFKTNILTWLKTKTYIKTEIDKLLQLKSNIGHTHTNASTTTPGFLSAEDKTKLNNLEQITVDSTINATSTNPVQNKVINTALTGKANTNHTHSITNITNLQSQLDGKANSVHTHDEYATKNHSSNKPDYGLSSTSEYGHCRVRNDLTAPTYIKGEALSAYQGQVIGNRLTAVESTANNVYENYTKNSMRIKIGRWSDNAGEDNTELKVNYKSDGIYAKLYCDKSDFNYTDKEVVLVINGIPYIRKINETGKSERLRIQLERGTYVLTAFIKSYEGLNPATYMKIITVI